MLEKLPLEYEDRVLHYTHLLNLKLSTYKSNGNPEVFMYQQHLDVRLNATTVRLHINVKVNFFFCVCLNRRRHGAGSYLYYSLITD